MGPNSEKPSTACFDVGGKIYKVSRSLLQAHPDTMLARIASETWQSDSSQTIFIERDNERFRYCLDYLRDGSVDLPMTVSKEALLKDFEYFGIEHDTDLVQGPKHLASVVATFHAQKERLEYCLLANECFGCYLRLGKLHIPVSELSSPMASKINISLTPKLFDEYLAEYGLKFCRFDHLNPRGQCTNMLNVVLQLI
jgi:hypothetical protein